MQKKHLLATLFVAGIALGATASKLKEDPALVPVPEEPQSATVRIVEARAFVLDEEETHYWRADRPTYRAGYLLVLDAPAELVVPRQTAEPVLFVGSQTAERLNTGRDGGHLVCLVPAELAKDGTVALDPGSVPIWFGDPMLPEQVDANMIETQLRKAQESGARAAGTSLAQTLEETLFFANRTQLDLAIADLIEVHSPLETDRVDGLRIR